LDEQWETQQAILKARRGEGQSTDSLKKKDKQKQTFQVSASIPPPANRGEPAMYFANEEPNKPKKQVAVAVTKQPPPSPQTPLFKFPWDK
jgi:hypothetical protein